MKKQADYWLSAANRDWQTARDLFKTKHYDACLFFCHLTLEKALKGLVVLATAQPAPYVHDLVRLALLAKLSPSSQQEKQLTVMTTFNIAGRYQDEKSSLYKKATPSYTKKHLNLTSGLILWLKKQYPKK